jgi:hypothetical protein
MDDQIVDVKETAGEEASIETPSVSEKATEEVETKPAETESTEEVKPEETKTETEETPKKGAEARIRELNAKANREAERAQSLEARLAELTRPVGQVETPLPPQIEPGQELTQEQYRQHVIGTANTLVDMKIKQNNAVNRINSEANQVVRKYPQLDPDSDSFDKELSDSVTGAVEAVVRAQPYTASPKKLVEKMMKPYERAVTREVGKQTEQIAKQVSETAMRPTSVKSTEKSAKEMTQEELEAKLGVVW